MEQFAKIFKNIAGDKQMDGDVKKGIGLMLKYLDKADEWIDGIPKDKLDNVFQALGERVREKLADMVRDGTINGEYLEKMHRLRMTLPSDITRTFEEILNAYYEKYKNKAK
jgi:hypothetical protein